MKENNEIRASIKAILEENYLLTLSTSEDNSPHSCTAFYVYDENFNLYIWTDKNSMHSKNIEKNNKVSINIVDTSQKWGTLLKGLQIKGTSNIIQDKDLNKVGKLYIDRYPNVSKFVKKPSDFHMEELESHLYQITPKTIKVLDEKKFGKEKHKELSLKK